MLYAYSSKVVDMPINNENMTIRICSKLLPTYDAMYLLVGTITVIKLPLAKWWLGTKSSDLGFKLNFGAEP